MKIFLTGGNGFIGKNIIEQLGGAYEIFAPPRAELDLTDTDAVYNYLAAHPVDAVIHAANVGGTRKQQNVFGITHVNLKIFFNLIRAKEFYGRLITLGSGAEYDKSRSLVKVRESDFGQHIPNDEYGLYKYVCARYAENVAYITHLRLFAVFGKHEDYEIRFISNAICKALLGLPVTMRQNVRFDYLFVDDLIRILGACLERQPADTFINVGRGESVDLKSVAERVIREVGVEVPILIANKGWGKEYTADTSRLAATVTGFAYTPLDIAIAKLVAYYRTILPTLNREAFMRDI